MAKKLFLYADGEGGDSVTAGTSSSEEELSSSGGSSIERVLQSNFIVFKINTTKHNKTN